MPMLLIYSIQGWIKGGGLLLGVSGGGVVSAPTLAPLVI